MTVGLTMRYPNVPHRVLLRPDSRGVYSAGASANAIVTACAVALQDPVRVRVRMMYVAFSGARRVTSTEAVLEDGEQLIQDIELHFEFDAVHGSLVGGLDVKVVRVFGDKEGDIQKDNEKVNKDEVSDDLPLLQAFDREDWFEGMHRLPDVESRNDKFLNAEAGELDLFVDDERLEKRFCVARVAAKKKYRHRKVKDADVCYNHDEDPTSFPIVAHDEMQAGVKDDGLSCYHGIPANDCDDAHGEIRCQLEEA
jgi:hypothetical protein